MASIPTQERIEEIQKLTQAAIEEKTKLQQEEGKDFIPTGAGVVPEEVWKSQKEQS